MRRLDLEELLRYAFSGAIGLLALILTYPQILYYPQGLGCCPELGVSVRRPLSSAWSWLSAALSIFFTEQFSTPSCST